MRLFLSALLLLIATPAMAGVLFPPSNAAQNSAGIYGCPEKTALVWSTESGGSLKCKSTSAMVEVAPCPAGYAMIGINHGGVANCAALPTLTTTASLNVQCPPGQVLVGISNNRPLCTPLSTGGGGSASASASATASSSTNVIVTGGF